MSDTNTTLDRTGRKPWSLIGMEPAADIESYASVPWYRRHWFALFPLFFPALLVLAATGDLYAKANRTARRHSDAEVWRYTAASRAFFVVSAILVATVLVLVRVI